MTRVLLILPQRDTDRLARPDSKRLRLSYRRLLVERFEFFLSVKPRWVVLGEAPQLPDPSRLLKIGADGCPRLKILATGSSTLAATQGFRDRPTGRKREVELVRVLQKVEH